MIKKMEVAVCDFLVSLAKNDSISLCFYRFLEVSPEWMWTFAVRRSQPLGILVIELLRTIKRSRIISDKLLNTLYAEVSALHSYGAVTLAGWLLERGDIERARSIIKLSSHRDDLNVYIKQNVSIACLMHEHTAIAEQDDIFCLMMASDTYTRFYEYLQSASIIVVGNSPCEIGKNKGELIDQHDIVIRFNNFHLGLDEHSADYGKKTSVWLHSGAPDVVFSSEVIDSVDYVVMSGELRYMCWHSVATLLKVYRFAPEKVVFFPGSVLMAIYGSLPLLYPTSGIKLLKWLALNNLNFKYCGFMLTDQDEGSRNYFFTKKVYTGTSHSWNREARVFNKLFKSQRI